MSEDPEDLLDEDKKISDIYRENSCQRLFWYVIRL